MFIDFFVDVFSEKNDSIAIIWKDKKYRYDWLNDNIQKCHNIIVSHQIKQGSVVALETF